MLYVSQVREHISGRKVVLFMMVIGEMANEMALALTVFQRKMVATRKYIQEDGRMT